MQKDITLKAILIGLIFVAINAYWVGIASELWYTLFTLVNPFSNAIFTLTILLIFSLLLGKISRRFSLSSSELMVIYIMVTMVSTISGATMMASMLGTLTQPFWFASPENEWRSLFWQHIPSWFTVSDSEVLRGYFYGESTFHTTENIKAWAIPILTWSSFIFFLYFSLLCISTIVRKRWIEEEKLSYPIVQLPLAMATDSNRFFCSRLMWIGLIFAASVRMLNGLHDIFPAIPQIPYGYRLDRFFTDKPWNAMGYTNMSFSLSIIGLTYFIPLDLAFSCWFFFWINKMERVFGSIAGWQSLYLNEQSSGAWIGIGLLALWISRRHLIRFFKHIIGLSKFDDSNEPIKFRSSLFLLFMSITFLVLFCYFAGMSLWAVGAYLLLFYLFGIAIARVRAELGPPYHEIVFTNPRGMMVDIFGSRMLRGTNLTVLTFLYPFNRCNRAHPMPYQIEALKISERVGMNGKRLLAAISLAIGFGAIATFWSYLHITYKYGTLAKCRGWISHSGWESFNPLQNWLQYPQGADFKSITFMIIGFGIVVFLSLMHRMFLWWPLHPSGYVLSGGGWGGMTYFWFPVMISWLMKSIILRYGGLKIHRKAKLFFLGLILGDFTLRSIWSIVSLILNIYMPASGAGHTL